MGFFDKLLDVVSAPVKIVGGVVNGIVGGFGNLTSGVGKGVAGLGQGVGAGVGAIGGGIGSLTSMLPMLLIGGAGIAIFMLLKK